MSTTAPLAPTAPKRFRRRLTTLLVGLAAMLALPGTAFAYTEPVTSGTGSLAAPTAVVPNVPGPTPTGSTVATTLVIALVAVLAVAIVILANRVLRRRTAAPRPVRV